MFHDFPSKARRTAAFAFAVAAFFGAFFAGIGAFAQPSEAERVPTWARRAAANGVWQVASFVPSRDVSSDVLFSGTLDDSYVLRGQVPPVLSPSTTAEKIGESTVYGSTAPFVLPPVTGDDPEFAPITPTLDDDATTIQKVFKYRDDISASYMFVPKGSSSGLGMHEVEGRILFAFPWETMRERTCLNNGYFLLTPSFRYNHWSQSDVPATAFKMPDSTFDAGLTSLFATNLRDLEVKVEVSVGVASSFKKSTATRFTSADGQWERFRSITTNR